MKTSLIASLAAISIAAICLNGCNTFSGMGKDLQAGGRAITNAANGASPSHKSTTKVTNTSTGTTTAKVTSTSTGTTSNVTTTTPTATTTTTVTTQ